MITKKQAERSIASGKSLPMKSWCGSLFSVQITEFRGSTIVGVYDVNGKPHEGVFNRRDLEMIEPQT